MHAAAVDRDVGRRGILPRCPSDAACDMPNLHPAWSSYREHRERLVAHLAKVGTALLAARSSLTAWRVLMKIGEVIYFAKGIPFSQVDLDGQRLLEQFQRRIKDLYIVPAQECADQEHPFAAGVLLVSCIDALARLRYGGGVGERFKKFLRDYVDSFATDHLAKKFYDNFRNGLVHEARLKTGAQFSLELTETVVESGSFSSSIRCCW